MRRRAQTLLRMATLLLFAVLGRRSLVATDQSTAAEDEIAAVGLASYGRRITTAWLTIESIGRGLKRPSRLILWLDLEESGRTLPWLIRRQQQRGLEVRYVPNTRSYKKIYPYAHDHERHPIPYVTADDDVLYPKRWLDGLLRSYNLFPEVVNGYRARQLCFSGDSLARYSEWKKCDSSEASFQTFLTGVSGVIYPPPLLDSIRDAGDAFLTLAPTADDVWLHSLAVANGYKHKQLTSRALEFPTIPGTIRGSLADVNVDGGANDRQVAAVYSRAVLRRIACDGDTDG